MTWKNEKKSKALLVVFGIYLALLVWCILFKFALRPEEIPHLRGINLIPYAASVVVNGKVQISEIIENMLVFLPFGLCISAFYPDSEIQNRILLASGLSLFFDRRRFPPGPFACRPHRPPVLGDPGGGLQERQGHGRACPASAALSALSGTERHHRGPRPAHLSGQAVFPPGGTRQRFGTVYGSWGLSPLLL